MDSVSADSMDRLSAGSNGSMGVLLNAADVILANAPRLADRPAIFHTDGAMNYGELADQAARAAVALAALGMTRGDRVGLLLNDSPLAAVLFLGVLKAGAVAVPLNPRLSSADYAFILADSQARLVIAEPAHVAMLMTARAADSAMRIIPARGDDDSFASRLSTLDGEQCARAGSAAMHASDPAFYLYSSGTTGRPKGIIHSHANCAHSGKLLREIHDANEHMTVLCTSKSFFALGLDNGLLGPLSLGAATILNADWPDAESILAQVARYRPDCLITVPTLFRRLLALDSERQDADRLAPLRQVRRFYTGGERLPDSVAQAWRDRVGTPIQIIYGMSETYCNVSSTLPGGDRSPASIGRPLAGVEIKRLDRAGQLVAADEPGILWVRHPSLATGYTRPDTTEKAFRDGWFCTNDLCTVDAEGFLYHEGRADELLKVAGQWVKPGEIEDAALADESIREAACVVVADSDGFERLALFVVPVHATPAVVSEQASDCANALTLESECLRSVGKHIAASLPRHSQPKWIRSIVELPRTPTGKVQRFRLRDRLRAEWPSG